MTDRHLDIELSELRQKILEMGGLVEKAIQKSVELLITQQASMEDEVRETENEINRYHKDIDDLCLRILARQSPVASDLRFILSSVRINTDLERMGDQAMNITYNARDFLKVKKYNTPEKVRPMVEKVLEMIRMSLDSFSSRNATIAQSVLELDDIVDTFKHDIFKELKSEMKQNPDRVEEALDLILVARNLERLGDHSTNIAESVIFLAHGKDVRHGGG